MQETAGAQFTVKDIAERERLTDEEVEEEIQALQRSEYVKLARAEQRIRNRRREYLYHLRYLEKKGLALAELGWTPEMAIEDAPL